MGIFLTARLKLLQVKRFSYILRCTLGSLLKPRKSLPSSGEITPFQALSTALAATVGTGNIAGVATAIFLGGPGAVFWMWVSAFFGMSIKYGEVVLAVHYRTKSDGHIAGGPMYFLKKGLKSSSLALLYSLFGSLAAFGIGNMVQANSVADALRSTFGVPVHITGFFLSFLIALIILGGIKRIALIASSIVPFMAFFYITASLSILILFSRQIPSALSLIFVDAFAARAAAGGIAGTAVSNAWRFGISRGIFTNEAGLGSASIAHAAARTPHPVRQGLWGVVEVFIDTHIICTITALVLLVTDAWSSGLEGASMTAEAFSRGLPGNIGQYLVSLSLIFFAFSTLLSWAYYGEKCAEYLCGGRCARFYRPLWIIFIFIGSLGGLRVVWYLADILNALMAFPNLLGLLGLSGVIVRLTQGYFYENRTDKTNKGNKWR